MSDPIRDGLQAQNELRQTAAAFDALKDAAIEAWAASPDTAAEFRERLYQTVQIVDAVRTHLFNMVATGEMEKHAQELTRALQGESQTLN